MRILGISGHYHDSAAALLDGGRIVAAAQEERFSRIKHDASFPVQAAQWCLREAGLQAGDLDAIAYYEKPLRKFDRILASVIDEAPRGLGRFVHAIPKWIGQRIWMRSEIRRCLGGEAPLRFMLHHESHAAAAFGPSPFEEAAVLTIDGVGEWTTGGLWRATRDGLEPLWETRYPHSLGLLYSAFTAYCGFRVNDGEYKLMGLAPYGEPRFAELIRSEVVRVFDDGSYRLNPDLFAYRYSDVMTTQRFHDLLGGLPRAQGAPITARDADLAASIQAVTEEILLRQARYAREETGLKDLCLAGGVALNCVANGELLREGIFERLWIQPAAGDSGGALGAAWALRLRSGEGARDASGPDGQRGSLLGPSYTEAEMESAIDRAGLTRTRLGDEALTERVAEALEQGKVVGWFQGAMEFGPRALGNRSILADARNPSMQSRVNLAVKFRESFRPFAPIVLEAEQDRFFELGAPSPYMLLVGSVREAEHLDHAACVERLAGGVLGEIRSPLPAISHVDASARVQSVAKGSNPPIEAVLEAFGRRTGVGVLLNTSFNVKDEPIVCSPDDAVACFLRTGIDLLALGPFLVEKGDDPHPRPPPVPPIPRSPGKAILAATAAVLGWFLLDRVFERESLALVALGVGLGMAVLGLMWPAALAAVERLLTRIGGGVARAISVVVLTITFFVVVGPIALIRRVFAPPPSSGDDTGWHSPDAPGHDPKRGF